MLKDITITSVLNGWIVRVGCQTVVFNDMARMLKDIEAYLNNPVEAEKSYQSNSVNAGKVGNVVNGLIGNTTVATAGSAYLNNPDWQASTIACGGAR